MFVLDDIKILINDYHALSESDKLLVDNMLPLTLTRDTIVGMIRGICLSIGAAISAHPAIVTKPIFILPVRDTLGCLLAHLAENDLDEFVKELNQEFPPVFDADSPLGKGYEV